MEAAPSHKGHPQPPSKFFSTKVERLRNRASAVSVSQPQHNQHRDSAGQPQNHGQSRASSGFSAQAVLNMPRFLWCFPGVGKCPLNHCLMPPYAVAHERALAYALDLPVSRLCAFSSPSCNKKFLQAQSSRPDGRVSKSEFR